MDNPSLEPYRRFLKDTIRKEIDFSQTPQQRGVPPPPIQAAAPSDARRIDLVADPEWKHVPPTDLTEAIRRRRSRRRYAPEALGLEELSYLLWATQGVREKLDGGTALRTVPSAGARHPFETHLCVLNVTGVQPGFYRYLPLDHQLVFEFTEDHLPEKITAACFGQRFAGQAAAVFVWTAVPYRTEWRYLAAAHKVIAIDAGHVGQNLYLACEAVGAGTCAIAAYDQEAMDALVRVDGTDEFVIYLAPVGKNPS